MALLYFACIASLQLRLFFGPKGLIKELYRGLPASFSDKRAWPYSCEELFVSTILVRKQKNKSLLLTLNEIVMKRSEKK